MGANDFADQLAPVEIFGFASFIDLTEKPFRQSKRGPV